MPKAAKGTKTQICKKCCKKKFSHGNFTKGALTCKACVVGVDRQCGGCKVFKPVSDFQDGERKHCRECNQKKDTAEHVDVCATDGCGVSFQRDPDTFTWKSRPNGGNWNTRCKKCCTPKPKVGTTKCSKCGYLKPPEEFTHGLECKDCRSTRTKMAREAAVAVAEPHTTVGRACTQCNADFSSDAFRWQGDRWSSWCKYCFNAAAYHVAWREKKMTEDPVGYREHNNDVLRAWRLRNPDLQIQQQLRNKRNTSWLFNRWVRQAERRGLCVAMDQREDIETMFLQACHYCGYLPADDQPLNTLDRVDNEARQYNTSSSITCCVPCNRLKSSKSVEEFMATAVAEAAKDNHIKHVDRAVIDQAHRRLGLGSNDKVPMYYHQQMWYIATHSASL